MILKGLVGNFTLDLPEPARKIRIAPADWKPINDYPELHGFVGLDTETDDPGLAGGLGSSWAREGEGSICGFSIAQRGIEPFYVGLNHAGGNSDPVKALSWLKHQAAKPDVTFVYANAIYDLGWLRRNGIVPANAPIDVQGMAALLDSERYSYSLDALMWEFLQRRKSTDGLKGRAREYGIMNPYLHMLRLPAWDVAPYAVDDVVGTLDLYYHLMPMIEEQDLVRLLKVESGNLLVALDLRWNGVRVDMDKLNDVHNLFKGKRDGAIDEIKRLTGVAIGVNDTTSIARALQAENSGVEIEYTSKGVPAVRVGLLDALGTPVAGLVREARQYEKAIGTTLMGLQHYVGRDGRVHGEFHPLRRSRDEDKGEGKGTQGVGPGRYASSNPNLQNIPRRVPEIAVPIRECFLPEEGERWAKLDYSSQEPRLATHFAYLAGLAGADAMVGRYRETPGLSLHKETAKLMGLENYDKAKIINLAILYGAGGANIAGQLGLPTKVITTRSGRELEVAGDEAQALMDLHFKSLPWIKKLQELAKYRAETRGYVTSILGRRQRFDRKFADGRRMWTHKALNWVIQPSAADQMKVALVGMRDAGVNPLVVVHDDANISIPQGEAGDRLLKQTNDIMVHAIELVVPTVVDASVGDNWGDVSKK
jgi:DNA polymerase I-like protein with 3'-5' exonuclease and polymerase domains